MLKRLQALARKYNDLAILREEREVAEAAGRSLAEGELAARAVAFRRLAAEFPGALRELDETPAALLRVKARAVAEEAAAVAAGGEVARAWVRVVADFHEVLARYLALKMALARGQVVAPSAELEAVRRPPGGRIVTLVWIELERRHGLPRARLEELVFSAQE